MEGSEWRVGPASSLRHAPLAPTLMVQGTASSVGKSLLVSALCRFFAQEGVRVAPFKAQNMALNAAVTPQGHEIGRAQAVQAAAAGLSPVVEMNPILLKPEADSCAQVVVMGRSIGRMTAATYHGFKPHLQGVIAHCLEHLRTRYDLVLIEGAGSPAEINLKDRDIVNMHVAQVADAPVLLVGDIDRGGVFAALVGTLALLEPGERERIAAFVINKFRGDLTLLQPGLAFLTRRTGKAVLGVVPHVHDVHLADEDSVALDARMRLARPGREQLDIVVVRLPRIANHDDVAPLERERGVVVRFTEHPEAVAEADLVILPGTKSTLADLAWLHARGIAAALRARAAAGSPILGICGGCQMLGETLDDSAACEGPAGTAMGLGLLPLRTRFASPKTTAQVSARVQGDGGFLTARVAAGSAIGGYEIHMGVVQRTSPGVHPFALVRRNGEEVDIGDGARDATGMVVGTMIHGLFDNAPLRQGLLGFLRQAKGIPNEVQDEAVSPTEAAYDRIAEVLRRGLDNALLWRIARVRPRGGG